MPQRWVLRGGESPSSWLGGPVAGVHSKDGANFNRRCFTLPRKSWTSKMFRFRHLNSSLSHGISGRASGQANWRQPQVFDRSVACASSQMTKVTFARVGHELLGGGSGEVRMNPPQPHRFWSGPWSAPNTHFPFSLSGSNLKTYSAVFDVVA